MAYNFKSLKVTLVEVTTDAFVAEVALNRPTKMNAMNEDIWTEIPICFQKLSADPLVRAIILYGEGKCFSAGLDLAYAGTKIMNVNGIEDSRFALGMRPFIQFLQESVSSLEKCEKPVIAAMHNLVIGGAFELVLNADIRLASEDAKFNLKEIDLGFASDLGGIQRLTNTCGNNSWAREVIFTGRNFSAAEALNHGVISEVLPNQEALLVRARKLASDLAKKSPLALVSTKFALIHARNHGVNASLEMQRVWNSWAIQSGDVKTAIAAAMSKDKITPAFPKL